MIPVKAKRGFYIAASCPACGAELELESDFLTTSCSSCNSVLRILTPATPPAYVVGAKVFDKDVRFHIDHHLKGNAEPLTDSLDRVRKVYFPYWKIDAILLRLRHRKETRINYDEETNTETSTDQRKVETMLSPYDITIAAGGLPEIIPCSLGERTEYVPMKPYSEEHLQSGFESLNIEIPWQDAITSANRAVGQLNHVSADEFGVNISLLLRPVLSLINFPYFLAEVNMRGKQRSYVLDGLTGRIVYDCNDSISDQLHIADHQQSAELGRLGVELHRCSNCGEQLPDTRSYVYVCRNCQQLTVLEDCPQLNCRILSVQGSANADDQYVPFWIFRLPAEQTNVFRIRFGGSENVGAICVPAFRIKNFEAMYRLTRRISGAVSKLSMRESRELKENYLPVAVGITEAGALAHVALMREVVGKSQELPRTLADLLFEEVSLFFAPFHPESYFLVDSCLGAVTFEKSLAGVQTKPVPTSTPSTLRM
jgi:DNA-directed RNA polymerase subunit RPC12/RpoP